MQVRTLPTQQITNNMNIEENNKVYVLTQSSGSYDDYSNVIIGVFSNKEDAIKRGRELDAECIPLPDRFPMSNEEFEELEYGMDDAGSSYVDRGGYKASDFELMGKLQSSVRWGYHECQVEEFSVDKLLNFEIDPE